MPDTDTPADGPAVETANPVPKKSQEKKGNSGTGAAHQKAAKTGPKPGQLPPYNVVLLNDDDHTFAYVIEMLRAPLRPPRGNGSPVSASRSTSAGGPSC